MNRVLLLLQRPRKLLRLGVLQMPQGSPHRNRSTAWPIHQLLQIAVCKR